MVYLNSILRLVLKFQRDIANLIKLRIRGPVWVSSWSLPIRRWRLLLSCALSWRHLCRLGGAHWWILSMVPRTIFIWSRGCPSCLWRRLHARKLVRTTSCQCGSRCCHASTLMHHACAIATRSITCELSQRLLLLLLLHRWGSSILIWSGCSIWTLKMVPKTIRTLCYHSSICSSRWVRWWYLVRGRILLIVHWWLLLLVSWRTIRGLVLSRVLLCCNKVWKRVRRELSACCHLIRLLCMWPWHGIHLRMLDPRWLCIRPRGEALLRWHSRVCGLSLGPHSPFFGPVLIPTRCR